jgi:hypothetical protein
LDSLDLKVLQEQLVNQDSQDQLDQLANQDLLEIQVHQVIPVHQDRKAIQVSLVLLEHQDKTALQVPKGLRVHLEQTVILELLDL